MATKALQAWVNELYVATRGTMPYFRFSLVCFGTEAKVIADNVSVLEVDVSDFILAGNSGSTNLAAALSSVRDILLRDGAAASHCPPFVFVFTDGRPTDNHGRPTEEAMRAALDAAAGLKVLPLACGSPFLIPLGYGEVNDSFMSQLATKPTLYHRLPNMAALIKLLPSIGTPTVEGGGDVASFLEQISNGVRER